MADIAFSPLVGIAAQYTTYFAANTMKLVLLNGRSVTPHPLVDNISDLTADVISGFTPVTVTGWTAPINTGASPPFVYPLFSDVTTEEVDEADGPVTGVAIYANASGKLFTHVLFDVANEVDTTGGTVTVECGDDGVIQAFAEEP